MTSQTILRDLEQTFGTIPKKIECNIKYLSYNEEHDDFTCLPCDKFIKKVSSNEDSTTKNFMNHLYSGAHRGNTIEDDELWRKLLSTFNGKVPQLVENNLSYLGVDGKDYECAICDKIIKVSSSTSATEKNFSYHLLSGDHEDKLEQYQEVLSQLHDVYGGIPDFVLNHRQFLRSNAQHYFCVICNKHIKVHPSDIEETEIAFEKHLHSMKHMRNAKESKAFSLLPELKPIFNTLPNYMLRNIDYISLNSPNFFCSLCNKNIKFNRHDHVETKQNLKHHFLSFTHDKKLNRRRNPENETFTKLHHLFETFPDIVLCELKYLSVSEEYFFCNLCNETIVGGEDDSLIENKLISHFASQSHRNNITLELDRQDELVEGLEDLFGSVPVQLQDNIKHMQFKGENNFECVLCNKIMKSKSDGKDYDHNTSVTLSNFENHLNSNQHSQELEALKELDEDLKSDLEELFSPIPQFIMNNIDSIAYVKNSDNFCCVLCDKIIVVDNGNKKEEITERNFRTHLLSVGHIAKLKYQANVNMKTTEMLEFIFNKVPIYILYNIEYLEMQDEHYNCTLCNSKIMRGDSISTAHKFREHLYGARHQSNIQAEEEDNDEALRRLDTRFWRVPEFLLRNIDFLCTYDNDLFCLLCQEKLLLVEDDLEETKRTLRCHLDSQQHRHNLSSTDTGAEGGKRGSITSQNHQAAKKVRLS